MREKIREDAKVEDIWKDLGSYSTYQKWLTFVLLFPQMPYGMIVLSPIFTGSSHVPFFCEDLKSANILNDNDNSSCSLNCTEGTSENKIYSSIVQEWSLVCGQEWIVETITSVQMAGMMTGAFVSSLISDHFGRKKCFLYQTFCMGVFGMLPALAYNPWTYLVARYLAGFGGGACFVVYISHLMEFLTPSWRILVGCINFFTVGEIFLAPLAYLIQDWRWLTVASAAPAVCLLPFYWLVQESPRWLLVRQKTDQAYNVFSTIAKYNNKPPPSMDKVNLVQKSVLREEASQVHGVQAVKLIVMNTTLFIHIAIETLCNLTCSVLYYGVSFNTKNLSGDPYWNMLFLGIGDAMAMPAVVIFLNWVGRKRTFTIYMSVATTFAMILAGLLTAGIDSALAELILSLGAKWAILTSWGALTLIVFESAPTNLRSTCGGFITFTGYFGTILAPQLFLLTKYHVALPYVIFCVLTTSSSISSWFLCETLGQPLQDTVGMRKL